MNVPFCTVSILSETAEERDLETVVMENHSLRKKVGRMEAQIEEYKKVIATLVNLINT